MVRLTLVAAIVITAGCGGAQSAGTQASPPAQAIEVPVVQMVRSRCATDGRDVFVSWRGQVHADEPGRGERHLFDVVGVSVAHCGHTADGGWYLATRELLLYLDPATGRPLHRWRNPWTGAELTVVHVANDPVQSRLPATVSAQVLGDRTRFVFDIPLSYPNPLAGDERLRRYSPDPTYRARERFELESPTAATRHGASADMDLRWDREGPWLPWMDMGDRPGRLRYRSRGGKRTGLDDIPELLREEIVQRLPAYRRAPRCLTQRPNVTSWTYFAEHLDDYLAGERFPRPQAASDSDRCGADR